MPDFALATIAWGGSTITLLDLMKQLLSITDNSQDDELSMYLQIAGEAAESYIDNKLVLQTVTERFISERTPIALRYFPAGDLTLVELNGDDKTTDWSTFYSDGIVYAESGDLCDAPFEQLDLTYDAGFDPLPAEVGYALTQIAINYQQSGGSTAGSIKKESIVGVGSIEYVTAADTDGSTGQLSPATIGVLDRYRRVYV